MNRILASVAFAATSIGGIAPIEAHSEGREEVLVAIIKFPHEFTFEGETFVLPGFLFSDQSPDKDRFLASYIPSDCQAKAPLVDIVSPDYAPHYLLEPRDVPCIIADIPVFGSDRRPVLNVFAFDEFPNREVLGIEWLLYFKESLVEGINDQN